MKLAKELIAPFNVSKVTSDAIYYARVDIDKHDDVLDFIALYHHGLVIPIMVKNNAEIHPNHFDKDYFAHIIQQYVTAAHSLAAAGITKLVIATDDDSVMQKILSPRFNPSDLSLRQETLLATYSKLRTIIEDVVVLLTVEELAPAGLDATDGIAIALALQERGLKEIIATSGTKDFMPLFLRRATQKKAEHPHFSSNEPGLACALWIKEFTGLSTWCSTFIDNEHQALELAGLMGLAGVIKKIPHRAIL